MAIKFIHRYFWMVYVAMLVACGKQTGSVTPIVNVTDANNTALAGAFTEVAQTMAAVPTSTAFPITDTVLSSTTTPLPFRALNGLRVVYTDIDGNLYVQDSGKSSIKLTHDVKESVDGRPPLISDDGQKIVFYRTGEAKLSSHS